ncbi:MAG: hypothetical protein JSU07_07095 [Bacteroidetes bacterium]|nr:hypothetical protein [Bacteroidota bacterium]
MKIFKTLAAAFILSLSLVSLQSCGGDKEKEINPLADSLKTVNGNLNGQLSEKEAALQEFINSFNEIQENLNAIKDKEKIVTNASSGADVKSKESQIKEDIQAIYDLMAKNKNRIGSLSKKLKDSNLKIEGMQKMIENLQASLNQKDTEISDLKSKIESLNIELASLNTNYQQAETESEHKTEELNTAYYAIGTSKELKEKNVITKEGGFIGIGKSTKIKADFNKDYFTKIDITKTTTINIGAKKAKILTNHPSSSYKFVGQKPIEKIEISNPADFWGASKYCVIIID